MPLSFQQHTANGSTSVFDASQIDGYLSTGHIYVFVNDVQKTAGVHYTLQTSPSLQVTFNPAHIPAFKDEVRIQRLTPNTVADRVVDFADGSVLTANDLDQSALQSLFITQEAEDLGSGALGKSFDQLSWNAEGLPIISSTTSFVPDSLVTKQYVDNLALYGTAVVMPQSWAFSGDGVQDLFTLSPVANATNVELFIVEVGGTILRTTEYSFPAASQIQFTSPPALGTNNIRVRNLGVSRNVNESVSTAMLQNNAVTTLKILDANVTAAKLASNSVETAKIVNLAVTTGKINDLAVTTGKLDNLAVTAGKIAAGAVTSAKLDTNISVTGTLAVGSNLTITAGDIVVANTRGIDFSATANGSGTPTTEKLTDYEEGTWVPVFEPQTGAFGSITYDIVSARYTKIGNMVIAAAHMRTNNVTVGTAVNDLYVGGFPYTQANIQAGGGAVTFAALWNVDHPGGLVGLGLTNRMLLTYRNTAGNAVTTSVKVGDLSTGALTSRNELVFTVTYWTV